MEAEPLEAAAKRMRAYVFAHPVNQRNYQAAMATRMRSAGTGPDSAIVEVEGIPIHVSLTYMQMRTIELLLFSFVALGAYKKPELRALPQHLVDALMAAFLHPADVVEQLPAADRRQMYAAMGVEPDVVSYNEQFIVVNPRKE